jgi:hypothetical protein
MSKARKVAAFRRRLASVKINWVIDIPVRRRITLELTPAQQQQLRRATRQRIRALTLGVYPDVLHPQNRALAIVKIRRSREGG